MGSLNEGAQEITYKYSTPLKAEYLNNLFNKVSSEGLCSRPRFVLSQGGVGSTQDVTICKFSLIIHPRDDINQFDIDEDGNQFTTKMVKVTTTANHQLYLGAGTVAIGFTYRFTTDQGGTSSQWFGQFHALTLSDIRGTAERDPFDGIIIATVITHRANSTTFWSVSTRGADISDLLLSEEGWDCKRWVSLISPKRPGFSRYDKLELRCHNEPFEGYINGHLGMVKQDSSNTVLSLPLYQAQQETAGDYGILSDSEGTRFKYALVKHTTEGLKFAQMSNVDTLVQNTDGGVLALVDSATNLPDMISYGDDFSNRLLIKPVVPEQINIYYDGNVLCFA